MSLGTSRLVVDIAKNFSRRPAGRYRSDGPYSGHAFLEDVLLPAMDKAWVVEVHLDGTRGYGSSFLDGAFGALGRSGKFTMWQLIDRLDFKSADPMLLQEVNSYLFIGGPQ